MIGPILLVVGVAAIAGGALVLATFGQRYRVGRLLGGTTRVSVDEALAIARSGAPRYVRVDGRIDAEAEFEDDLHRPLVFRRERIDVRNRSGWQRFGEERRTVDFEIRDGLSSIAVDHSALDDGLVVIPRESTGTASEIPGIVGDTVDPAAPARLRIEQVSSVEHAIVLGRPRLDGDGRPEISGGLGRPLVLTTLDPPEAMRILAAGARVRPMLAAALLAGGAVSLLLGIAAVLVGAIA